MTHVTGAYFSPTGGTKRALEAVCSLFEGEAELLELTGPNKKEKQFTPEDLLVLALPVYAGQHPAVPGLLDGLKGDSTPCMILATYGNRHYDDALLELKTLGEQAGCVTTGAGAFVAQHSLNPDMGRGRPDASDAAAMRGFGKALRAKLDGVSGEVPPLDVPGNAPYRAYQPTPFAPALLDAESCLHCGLCARVCPVRIIDPETFLVSAPERCLFCFGCVRACPVSVRGPRPEAAEAFAAKMAGLAARCTVRRDPETFL